MKTTCTGNLIETQVISNTKLGTKKLVAKKPDYSHHVQKLLNSTIVLQFVLAFIFT